MVGEFDLGDLGAQQHGLRFGDLGAEDVCPPGRQVAEDCLRPGSRRAGSPAPRRPVPVTGCRCWLAASLSASAAAV